MGHSKEKQTKSWSTHDLACTPCREKKTRCGRERPKCETCKREGLDCGYSTPGKRINHVKLLCQNFSDLEDRLSNIQGEITNLASSLETSGKKNRSSNKSISDESASSDSMDDEMTDDASAHISTGRHIVRNQGDHAERYHGPCTLYALCKEFGDTTCSNPWTQAEAQQSGGSDWEARSEAVRGQLSRLCLEASTEEIFDVPSDYTPIRLPPKQFLRMAQAQFFQHVDYTTDIFVQSSFASNMERIYNKPFQPEDEVWAICYNIIILLVLGSENPNHGNDALLGSQFVRPFLLTVRMALNNPQILMATKLVNVQALALLSVAAQRYYPPGFSESIFAQACLLVRKIGLHQIHAASHDISPEEAEERVKVVRSIYLRDKSNSISRGSICWLPKFDCSISSVIGLSPSPEPEYTSRIELASIQEEIYRLFHSAESRRRSSAKHKSALTKIERELDLFANANEMFQSPRADPRDVQLKLDFLATRISAFRESSEASHVRRALNDARASCLFLITSYNDQSQAMLEWLDNLLISMRSLKSLGEITRPRTDRSSISQPPNARSASNGDVVPSWFQGLLDSFSAPAFFLLVKNILWPVFEDNGSNAEEDLNLLQMVCACYKQVNARVPADNYIRRVGRVFERLLEVANLIKNPQPLQIQDFGIEHDPSNDIASLQNIFLESPNNLDVIDPSALSMGPVPPMLSWDSFSTHSASTATNNTPRTGSSPNLLSNMEIPYLQQQTEPLRHHSLTNSHRSSLSSPKRVKRRLDEMDEPSLDSQLEATMLFDFPGSTPEMNFDPGIRY